MCLSPISLINPSKFISKVHRERYVFDVPCGKCCECQKSKHDEWYLRSYYHFKNCVDSGGYVLFDTLTYNNQNLPHLSDFFGQLEGQLDYPCFNVDHYRYFFVRLRRYLSYHGYDPKGLTYFLTSEYGTDDRYSHRPHYHILFYCPSNIPPLVLSRAVSLCWKFGRTDGVKYHGSRYVLENRVFRSGKLSSIWVSNYVSKYVQKSSVFQKEIDKRLQMVLASYASSRPDGWLDSSEGRKFKRSLYSQVAQFHRQSQGFGISALAEIDINSLFVNSSISMPDVYSVKKTIPLPLYFKRKLFYELVEFNGLRSWQPTDFGKKYLDSVRNRSFELLHRKFYDFTLNYPESKISKLDLFDLTDYCLNYRGRIKADSIDFVTYEDKVNLPLWYNYSGILDREHFGKKFVSHQFCGIKDAYLEAPPSFPIRLFIQSYIIDDSFHHRFAGFDSAIAQYYDILKTKIKPRQDLYDNRQRLTNLYKTLCVV